jgi:hypothetical protein
MVKEADFAFRQSYALCPTSPEALFRYINLLLSLKRVDDALLLAEATHQLIPDNPQVKDLVKNLKNYKPQK